MQVSFVDVDGVRTRYYHAGRGAPVVLVHGFGISADNWCRVLPTIANEFAVFAPDLIGHGFSDWRPVPSGVRPERYLARHVGRFMDTLGLERAAVVGTSLGGILVSLLALERPELVASLGLVGIDVPMSPSGTVNPDVIKAAMTNGTKAMQDVTWESCLKRMANICFDPAASPREVALMQTTIYAQSDRLEAYLGLGGGMAAREGLDQVRIVPEKISVPTLVLTGREDIRADIKTIEANYRRIAQAELVVLDRCGHLPHLEHPEKFASVLLDFLRRQGR